MLLLAMKRIEPPHPFSSPTKILICLYVHKTKLKITKHKIYKFLHNYYLIKINKLQ